MSIPADSAPRLYRRDSHRIVGGVAGGIADHLGMRPGVVRLVFVVLSVAGGIGPALYGAFWIVLPQPPGAGPRRHAWLELLGAVLVGVIAFGVATETMPSAAFFIPATLALFGGALLFRQATEPQRARWWRASQTSLSARPGERTGRIRIGLGTALVVVGGVLVLARADVTAIRDGLLATAVTIVGVALLSGPWWMRLVNDLGAERRERIRSQERADLAAHLHDSVLQTLALIQRNASSPREVARLARGQERELRTLLYGTREQSGQLASALTSAAGDVEDAYAITVDSVVVGDAELDGDLAALVAATREALVNAAKHAGVTTVSLYAEVEPAAITVFVKDRGVGFDPDTIADDRQGVRGSMIDRMERHGGKAVVRSRPGTGTEVELTLERT